MPLRPSRPAAEMLAPASFAGNTVVIVDVGHPLSAQLAADFVRYGASVAVVGPHRDHCQSVVAGISSAETKTTAAALDPADPDSVARCFEVLEERLGPVNVLINPFAQGDEIPAEQLPPTEWRSVTKGLLDGSFFCAQELARRRIDDGAGAVIVNFATPFVTTGGAGTVHWEAARAALANLTKSLAVEWAPYNIRVNAIAPGYLRAPEAASAAERAETEFLGRTVPAGRTCEYTEVSACALYMCTPFAAYLTGHVFDIDGASWQRPGRLPPKFESVRARHARRKS